MIISLILISIYTTYNTPLLTLVLTSYGIPVTSIGYWFAIPCVAYIIMTLLISSYIAYLPRRLLFFTSFIAVTLSLLLMGPSTLLGFPDDVYLIIAGRGLIGFA